MATKVKFYIDTEGEVLAFFPEIPHNTTHQTCYAHIGQHSACHTDYLKKCKLADPQSPEVQDLYRELVEMVGYDDLEVIDSRRVFTRMFTKGYSERGADIGRPNVGYVPIGKVEIKHVPLVYGYDPGGAYWGNPNNLYVKFTRDLKFVQFLRK